ncbi:hypothetical protein EG329_007127 [Mollisiaceae sp. DMI_Dod_QoI]|nr:hypothetical protein EG329_007127 [Helotiales sp. DMI_Dod_QoI]
MQLTRLFAILSLAAVTIAAPTVEPAKRTSGNVCNQNVGVNSCCPANPVTQSTKSLDPTMSGALGGILGILPILLDLDLPSVPVAVQCNAIIGATLPLCGAQNVCCMTPYTGNPSQSNGNLISLLNNDNIALCPGITF